MTAVPTGKITPMKATRGAAGCPAGSRANEDLRLLRHYEPVLRFTRGELFLPMPVERYIERSSLWRSSAGGRARRRAQPERVCGAEELTSTRLAEIGPLASQGLWLRFAERSLSRKELRDWRRDPDRPRLAAGTSRFAAVGLLSRLIDAVLRLSLLLRGRVPGGTTAAAEQRYRADADTASCPYYGRVVHDRGFVVLQYWYFYAMNDWRSTFGGVNDHEADWEQVTLFLPDPPDLAARPAWIAFSSHDEVGDDLRRRSDDPDLQWHDTHPVVFVGAGSHSGAYLAGDYLVTVEPPALKRVTAAFRRRAGCCCLGPAPGPAPPSAFRSSTTGGAMASVWDPASSCSGVHRLQTTRRHGCATTEVCGDWTLATRSAGSARRPALRAGWLGPPQLVGPGRMGRPGQGDAIAGGRAAGDAGPDDRAGRSARRRCGGARSAR